MKRNFKESDAPINALPDYKIRTMKDDLAGKGLKELEKEAIQAEKEPKKIKEVAPPDKLPVVPEISKQEKKIPEPPKPPIPPKPAFIPPTPIKPPAPVKLKTPRPKYKTNFKFLLIIFLIAIAFVGGVYWITYEPVSQPLPDQPQVETLSDPLFSVNQLITLSLAPGTSLIDLIKQESQKEQLIGTFKRIAILKNETQYLSLTDLLEELKINIPPYTLSELGDNYTLAIYSQDGMKRLVLATEIKNAANLKEQLGFWEQTMVNDLKSFLLIDFIPNPATPGFQNNIYPPDGEAGKDTTIRYINFPEPDLTIDYTIKNNLFILTTSKESMYSIIDLLAPSDSRGVDKL